jgi:hypothetical protein
VEIVRVRAVIAVVVCSGLVACGGAGGSSAGAPEAKSEIARLHKAKCGACHLRVEPGERSRAQLEAAFVRHRTRVHMSEERWGEMVDYLASPGDAGAARAADAR